MDEVEFVTPELGEEGIERGKGEGVSGCEGSFEGEKAVAVRVLIAVTGVAGREEMNRMSALPEALYKGIDAHADAIEDGQGTIRKDGNR